MRDALAEIRVLDPTQGIAGPFGVEPLADQGAVFVVERHRLATLDPPRLGFERVRARNSRICLTAPSNFGDSGPDRDCKPIEGVSFALALTGGKRQRLTHDAGEMQRRIGDPLPARRLIGGRV